jgi:hypothetical protein
LSGKHLAVEQFGAAALNDELALVANDAGAPHRVELVVATSGHGLSLRRPEDVVVH